MASGGGSCNGAANAFTGSVARAKAQKARKLWLNRCLSLRESIPTPRLRRIDNDDHIVDPQNLRLERLVDHGARLALGECLTVQDRQPAHVYGHTDGLPRPGVHTEVAKLDRNRTLNGKPQIADLGTHLGALVQKRDFVLPHPGHREVRKGVHGEALTVDEVPQPRHRGNDRQEGAPPRLPRPAGRDLPAERECPSRSTSAKAADRTSRRRSARPPPARWRRCRP